jgi:hypothetical protein
MFEELKNSYNQIRGNYHFYRENYQGVKRSRIFSFFKSLIDYITHKPTTHIIQENEREQFLNSLDNKVKEKYDIEFKPGQIRYIPKKSLDDVVS